MREILFRGKRTDNGEWIEGCYLDRNNIGIFFDDTEEEDCKVHIFSVNSSTVGQYTGLTDKNGKKIFEGDIVRAMMDWGPAGMIESVVDIGFKKYDGYRWNYFDLDTIEIIGNVYENPELLEVK